MNKRDARRMAYAVVAKAAELTFHPDPKVDEQVRWLERKLWDKAKIKAPKEDLKQRRLFNG